MKYTTISNGNVIKSEPTFSTAAKRSRKSSERKTVESSSDEMNSGADNSLDTSTGTFQYLGCFCLKGLCMKFEVEHIILYTNDENNLRL